ncbi:MAG: phage integrase SAM-like domain-containing protein, partial [Bacteroidota bacterium]
MSISLVTQIHKTNSVKRKDGKFPIVLLVTWNRNVRRKRLGIYAFPEQWDMQNREFKKGVHGRRERNSELEVYEKKANNIYKKHFEGRNFNYKQFIEFFEDKPSSTASVFEFCKEVAKGFEKRGQAHSAMYYEMTGRAVLKVSPNDISFEEFTEDWLREFEDYYQSRGVKCFNYMVHLRSIYNKAVQKKIADFRQNPFKNPYTNPYGYDFSHLKKSKIGQFGNRIKDLSKEQLIALKQYEPQTEKEAKFLSIWFFSFYNFGVNLIDVAHLKRSDIRNGRWYYSRSKTGTGLKNGKPLLPEALEIIEKYDTGKEYIFDILNGYDKDERTKAERTRKYARYIRICHISDIS